MTVELGRRYRDPQTGIEGTAVARTEHQHGCARVLIEYVTDGKIEEVGFDEPRLVEADSGRSAAPEEARPGGPKPAPGRLSSAIRRSPR